MLYDAEDRPHPAQLLEAWQIFRASSPRVACLQAPLEISNRDRNLVARMFGLEYSALFHGLLPFLSRHHLLLPLGGTSNHFRRNALESVGNWDPFNVTEDADLGMRLLRCGYRTQTLTRPTYEPAPDRWRTWVPQRTRWFKGWCLTARLTALEIEIKQLFGIDRRKNGCGSNTIATFDAATPYFA